VIAVESWNVLIEREILVVVATNDHMMHDEVTQVRNV